MSETTNLKLKKHDNPETNTEKFDVENYLNGNWDKIDKNVGEVNTNISNINSKNKEQDTNIEQLQENTETSSNKIAELEKELKEAQEDFYQNSIRGQASGEYIHVEDSSNCRAKIGLSGNNEQKTRAGYNKLNMSNAKGGTSGGITCVINEDGSYLYKGTATTTDGGAVNIWFLGYYNSEAPTLFTLEAGTYYINDVLLFSGIKQLNKPLTKIYTFTSEVNITGVRAMSATPGQTYNEVKYPIIAKSNKELPWEQYGVSPSPGYPSEIKTVGDNINLYPGWESGTVNITSGEKVGDPWYIRCKDFIPIDYGVFYTISQINSVNFDDMNCSMRLYDKDKKYLGNQYVGDFFKQSLTFTVNNLNVKYIIPVASNGKTIPQNAKTNIKLEKGTVVTPYSKFGQGCVKVTKCNKNILKNIATSGALNGITRTVNEDGSVTINGTSTGWANLTVGTIKGDGNSYTLSGSLSNSEIFLSVNNSQEGDIAQSKNGNEITFIPKKGLTYNVIICIPSGKTFNNVLIKPLVRISSDKDNTYEQHEEQSYIMPTQTEMLENDYLDYDNEEEIHIWGKKILTGDEGWRMPSSNDTNAVFTNSSNTDFCDFKSDTDIQYCNCFRYRGRAQGFADALNKGVGIYSFYSVNKYEYIVAPKAIASSVNEWKAYLKSQYDAGTPVVIYYKLQTPKRLKFTDEQKAVAKELNNARTYKNVTNITTDSKAILSLDYAKDLETQNQKIQNEIDEIKQLLSTTQTSALLLDNLQKEVESEVE